jgi:hypothetical protein
VTNVAEPPPSSNTFAVSRARVLAAQTGVQPPVDQAASPSAPEQTGVPAQVGAALSAAPAKNEGPAHGGQAKSLATGPGVAASSHGVASAAIAGHSLHRPAVAGRSANRNFRVSADGIIYSVAVEINGASFGRAPVLVGSDNHLAIKLGDILTLLEPAMDRATYERLSSSKDADTFISFDRIRAAGIDIRYDTVRDRLILGS